MNFPQLELDSCRVLPFGDHHLTHRYVSWLNDPEVVRYSEQRHRRHTLESCGAYFRSVSDSADHFLAIEATAPDLGHIGNIGVSVDAANRVADVSIIVGEKRAWGTGLATRAWKGVVEQLLSGQALRKVTAGTMAVNDPMLRLMERSGMHIEGTRARHYVWEGQEVDLMLAAVFRNAGDTWSA